jgi:cytochrome c oxidase subunit 3
MASSLYYLHHDKKRSMMLHLFFTLACAAIFLVIKYFEYTRNIQSASLLAGSQAPGGAASAGASIFFALYFLMTGFQSLHVIAGTGLVAWVVFRNTGDKPAGENKALLEITGIYWQMGVLVWIFMFPLLYLM